MKSSNSFRKWSRIIHRDLSFFFAGMILIYAISGMVMNHRDEINPHFSVKRHVYTLSQPLPTKAEIKRQTVLQLLDVWDERENYTKHYFPQENQLKVFLKGGSSLVIDLQTGDAVYESVNRRPLLGSMTKLHYNPGKWWTWFADIFAVGLVVITLTGLFMVKGGNGVFGRGGIELLVGIVLPLLFLFFC